MDERDDSARDGPRNPLSETTEGGGAVPDSPELSRETAAALDALINELGGGRMEFAARYREDCAAGLNDPLAIRARTLTRRRGQALRSLGAVLAFLRSPAVAATCPDLFRIGGTVHLEDLHNALLDLDAGHPPDLFEKPPGQSKASPSLAHRRGRVAAAVEMMVRAGENPERAQAEIARQMMAGDYTTSRGKKSGRSDNTIRTSTVAAWCKRVREAGFDDLGRQTRDHMMRSAEEQAKLHPSHERAIWARSARLVIEGLVTGNPEGEVYWARLDFLPPGPGK